MNVNQLEATADVIAGNSVKSCLACSRSGVRQRGAGKPPERRPPGGASRFGAAFGLEFASPPRTMPTVSPTRMSAHEAAVRASGSMAKRGAQMSHDTRLLHNATAPAHALEAALDGPNFFRSAASGMHGAVASWKKPVS